MSNLSNWHRIRLPIGSKRIEEGDTDSEVQIPDTSLGVMKTISAVVDSREKQTSPPCQTNQQNKASEQNGQFEYRQPMNQQNELVKHSQPYQQSDAAKQENLTNAQAAPIGRYRSSAVHGISVSSRFSTASRNRRNSVLSVQEVRKIKRKEFMEKCFGNLLQHGGKSTAEEMEELKEESKIDSHKIPLFRLITRLNTDMARGLSVAEVQHRLTKYGLNQLKPPLQTPEWYKFLKQMIGGFCLLLWIGAALCFIAFGIQASTMDDPPYDYVYIGVVLATVVILTGIFAYVQEAKSTKIMETFKKFMPQSATITRDGCDQTVPVEEIVIGDIVKIRGGDKIPADCRIISASSLKVDNSCLTGESEPQTRTAEFTNDNILETRNVIFFSTFAVEGTGTGVVIATGDNTVMGRIARLTSGIQSKKTPLAIELERFVHLISAFAIVIGIVFLIVVLSLGIYWLDGVVFIIGIIVANVPEGLLIQVTLCLSLTAKRMAKHNALVKNLEAVETLGSTSTICSDKTGTLTQNKMTVSHLWFNDTIYEADISMEQSRHVYSKSSPGWKFLMRVSALCGRAVFKPAAQQQNNDDIMSRECIGDGSESALLKFGELTYASIDNMRKNWPKAAEIPFSSVTKVQVSIHTAPDLEEIGGHLLVMKGAPERIIDACSTYITGDGVEKPIDADFRDKFIKAYEALGGMGERVLGFCDFILPVDKYPIGFPFVTEPDPNFPLSNLRFLGLISMIDPPRPAVPGAVRKCRDAGIRVIMVTGDHPITATAIARAVGIVSPTSKTPDELAAERRVSVSAIDPREATAITIHGQQLREMTAEQLDNVIATHPEIVFARTSPQQKLLIVEGFQRAGAIVAVTGDGVNDSPALKKADIGIAMGIAGSDVSKQAADMILMDDNFATIVFSVEEGRVLFDNLKKCICYILTSNIPELSAPLIYVIFAIPAPLGTVPMLCIDLGTDFVPAVTYAYEPAESDIMRRKPRHPVKDKLVNYRMMSVAYGQHGMIEALAALMSYFVVMCECGFLPERFFGLRDAWDSKALNNLHDSYGQEWTYHQRKTVEYTIYSTYFIATVIMQWCDLVICKTRRMSIFHQGWTNQWQTFGLVFETAVAVLICYTPGISTGLNMLPVRGLWWLIAFPYALLMFLYDQGRKWIIRKSSPTSWITTEFYY